ncbi:Glycosyltransferase involved in cell wall bisynthesis [Cyclonatronum proteinivorum]|uniref:Glycosyltransferase involved in cell wall bisynthesis n=1 Tax=Cyclonatronum proteinivorum TaxID=1457365 RepID=A0A345UGY0_9BACT|nr:glycosyltransferase family 4 protein [Cyclonatronum proteinivorum]AXI99731.1 Glycosyltransferase involved in cell wall bisynthesis [Cyclonatronum proteinivorum]
MARILIITQYFLPEITAAAYRLSALESYLTKQGHDVDVITTFPHRSPNEQAVNDTPKINRVSMPTIEGSTKGRIKEQLWFMVRSFIAFISKPGRYDYVIATSPPLFAGLSGYFISKLCGGRFILDIRDIWPGSIIATGLFSSGSIPIRLASFLERFLYHKAAHITTVAKPMATYVRQYKKNSDVSIVYNGVDELINTPVIGAPDSDFKHLNLVYAGNFGLVQGLDLLIRAVNSLEEKHKSQLKVSFLGQGFKQKELESLAAELGVSDRVSFAGPYTKSELTHILAEEAHALFIHLKSDPSLNLTIPSKVFDCMQYNIPIVYGLSGEAHEILNNHPGNISFRQDSVEDLKLALEKLVNNYKVLHAASAANRTFVKDNFLREECFQPFLNIIY